MNKTELVAAIAERTELTKKDADQALKAFIDVAAAGYTGEDIVGEPISHILENILDDRDERLPLSERNRFIPVIHGMEEHEQICQVIRSNGQIIGAIIIQAKDRKQGLGESEKKIALVAAEFLGKQVSV